MLVYLLIDSVCYIAGVSCVLIALIYQFKRLKTNYIRYSFYRCVRFVIVIEYLVELIISIAASIIIVIIIIIIIIIIIVFVIVIVTVIIMHFRYQYFKVC